MKVTQIELYQFMIIFLLIPTTINVNVAGHKNLFHSLASSANSWMLIIPSVQSVWSERTGSILITLSYPFPVFFFFTKLFLKRCFG